MRTWSLFLLAALLLACSGLEAQEGCQPPPVVTRAPGSSIFTDQQEVDLGDAMAEQLDRTLRQTSDEAVTGELERIGDHLAKHLPPNQLKFRYFLVDWPIPQAFAISGGRIYVTRKMVALVKNEDEMAGVLGHEMGHIVTHQFGRDYTRLLKQVLGVTQVGDRRDVFDKFTQLLDNWRRNPKAWLKIATEREGNQLVADQVALYAVASAGYSPQAYADVFDRLVQTQGKTGDWFSELFRTTRPDEHRLREMLDAVERMPAACVDRERAAPSAEFQNWQRAVINYTGWDDHEALHGVLAKVQLQPPLRESLTHLKFSPDGKYLLAEDADKIYVMTAKPLDFIFAFDAPDAESAQFTPDSTAIVFQTSRLRVETWDVATHAQTSAYEPVFPRGCAHAALAPDGKTMGCIGPDLALTLMDVASGNVLLQKERFGTVESATLNGRNIRLSSGHVSFSPDGRYFVAASQDHSLAFDVASRTEVDLHGDLKGGLGGGFTFLAPDRVAGRASYPLGAPVAFMEFPSGKVLKRLPLGLDTYASATRGAYLLVHPVMLRPAKPGEEIPNIQVVDLRSGKVAIADKRPGLDVYDNTFARELLDGQVGLYDVGTLKLIAQVKLPGSGLGSLRSIAASADLKWVAASQKRRGAVWNLADGSQLCLLRGFNSAYLPGDGFLYADFPKFEETERSIAQMSLAEKGFVQVRKVEESNTAQHGRFLVVTTPAQKVGADRFKSDVTREIRDVRTGAALWSRHFAREAPALAVEPDESTMVLYWPAAASAVAEELANFPALRDRWPDAKKDQAIFLEAMSLPSGKPLGALFIDTGKGSFRVNHAFAVGDSVVVYDNLHEVAVYALSTGEKKGEVVGSEPEVSPGMTGLLSVRGERGQLAVYDIDSLEQLDQFAFSTRIVFDRFSPDGKRLFVLTAGQTGYFLDLSGLARLTAGK